MALCAAEATSPTSSVGASFGGPRNYTQSQPRAEILYSPAISSSVESELQCQQKYFDVCPRCDEYRDLSDAQAQTISQLRAQIMDLRTEAKRLATNTTEQVQLAQDCIEQLLENMKVIQDERDQALAKMSALLSENRTSRTQPIPNQTLELRREKAASAELLKRLHSLEERHKRAMWKLKRLEERMNRFYLRFLLRRINRLELLQKLRVSSRSFIRPIYRNLQRRVTVNCQINGAILGSRRPVRIKPVDVRKPIGSNMEICASDLKSRNSPELEAKNRRIAALRQELRAVAASKDKTMQLAGHLAKTYDSLVVRSRASQRQSQRKDAVISIMTRRAHVGLVTVFHKASVRPRLLYTSWSSDGSEFTHVAQTFASQLRRKLWALLDAYSTERNALQQKRCQTEEERQRQSALIGSLRESLQLSQRRLKAAQLLVTKKDSENTALLEATQRLQAELDSQRTRLRVLLQERRLSTAQLQTLRVTVDRLQVTSQTAEEEKRAQQAAFDVS
ncbi:unnamed protein product [Schistocephalus solidus]|uniref:Uncharacterized protein n=1 Tax=Schistocephalus solidus TaxID=70667 RepID=A0A183SES7_SCHSO|nr:unnamed protein product [Schistocephalus solidus]